MVDQAELRPQAKQRNRLSTSQCSCCQVIMVVTIGIVPHNIHQLLQDSITQWIWKFSTTAATAAGRMRWLLVPLVLQWSLEIQLLERGCVTAIIQLLQPQVCRAVVALSKCHLQLLHSQAGLLRA